MRLKIKLLLVATCLVLSACNDAALAPEKADAVPVAEPARVATYESSLQSNNIVWDSLEKQQAWEQRNAVLGETVAAELAISTQPAAPLDNFATGVEPPAAQ